ncbi:MAG: DNA recombination protein RmuC [SAR324 cluster bacterium]|nr:DNA recombination protein RmuC [SAR324 cluster bacterium]
MDTTSLILFGALALAIIILGGMIGVGWSVSKLIIKLNHLSKEQEETAHCIKEINNKQSDADKNLALLNQRSVNEFTNIKSVDKVLQETTGQISATLAEAKGSISLLKNQIAEQREEQRKEAKRGTEHISGISSVLDGLNRVITGSKSKGQAGENIVDNLLKEIPPKWRAEKFKIAGKQVEFALRLPNNRVLSIDSKWLNSSDLEALDVAKNAGDKDRITQKISRNILKIGEGMDKYIDPKLTIGFAILTVPDAIFQAVYPSMTIEIIEKKIALVSYSNLLSFLLLVMQWFSDDQGNIDMVRLHNHLVQAESNIKKCSTILEGKFSTGITMITNARTEIKEQVDKLQINLTAATNHQNEDKELEDDKDQPEISYS